jgi:hypothetical protein
LTVHSFLSCRNPEHHSVHSEFPDDDKKVPVLGLGKEGHQAKTTYPDLLPRPLGGENTRLSCLLKSLDFIAGKILKNNFKNFIFMQIFGVTFQFSGELIGKENIGQLAVCVGQHTVVAALIH